MDRPWIWPTRDAGWLEIASGNRPVPFPIDRHLAYAVYFTVFNRHLSFILLFATPNSNRHPLPHPTYSPHIPPLQHSFYLHPTMAVNKDRHARFNRNPVAEVRSFSSPSPASSTSSLAPSPGPSTPPPLPNVAFSPAHSPTPFHSPPHPMVYTPSPIPQAHALPYIPPAPLTPGVYIHPALAAPSLLYDMRSHPSQSNPRLPPGVLTAPASCPPLPSLALRVGDLPWLFTVFPDVGHSPKNAFVTVQDVLLAIYIHLRTAAKAEEYDVL